MLDYEKGLPPSRHMEILPPHATALKVMHSKFTLGLLLSLNLNTSCTITWLID